LRGGGAGGAAAGGGAGGAAAGGGAGGGAAAGAASGGGAAAGAASGGGAAAGTASAAIPALGRRRRAVVELEGRRLVELPPAAGVASSRGDKSAAPRSTTAPFNLCLESLWRALHLAQTTRARAVAPPSQHNFSRSCHSNSSGDQGL
jgi:hypothetical protein